MNVILKDQDNLTSNGKEDIQSLLNIAINHHQKKEYKSAQSLYFYFPNISTLKEN